jgi:hypothetical protein
VSGRLANSNSPTCYGGLAVLDLKVAGFALRLRWEWLRRSRPDLGWCGLPKKPEREIQAMFQSSVTVVVSDGLSAKF